MYLCRVLLQLVLSSVVVTEWTMSSSREWGSWEGTALSLASFVEMLVCLSTKEFEVNLPLLLPIVLTSLSVRTTP